MNLKFINDLITESNGTTYSLARVAQAIGVGTCIAAAGTLIYTHGIDNGFFEHFGGGLALIFGGGALNSKFTPEAPHDNDDSKD